MRVALLFIFFLSFFLVSCSTVNNTSPSSTASTTSFDVVFENVVVSVLPSSFTDTNQVQMIVTGKCVMSNGFLSYHDSLSVGIYFDGNTGKTYANFTNSLKYLDFGGFFYQTNYGFVSEVAFSITNTINTTSIYGDNYFYLLCRCFDNGVIRDEKSTANNVFMLNSNPVVKIATGKPFSNWVTQNVDSGLNMRDEYGNITNYNNLPCLTNIWITHTFGYGDCDVLFDETTNLQESYVFETEIDSYYWLYLNAGRKGDYSQTADVSFDVYGEEMTPIIDVTDAYIRPIEFQAKSTNLYVVVELPFQSQLIGKSYRLGLMKKP